MASGVDGTSLTPRAGGRAGGRRSRFSPATGRRGRAVGRRPSVRTPIGWPRRRPGRELGRVPGRMQRPCSHGRLDLIRQEVELQTGILLVQRHDVDRFAGGGRGPPPHRTLLARLTSRPARPLRGAARSGRPPRPARPGAGRRRAAARPGGAPDPPGCRAWHRWDAELNCVPPPALGVIRLQGAGEQAGGIDETISARAANRRRYDGRLLDADALERLRPR
jgi:hypothetical protein